MRSLFFINETIKPSAGISKKILSQVAALAKLSEESYFCRLVESDGHLYRQVDGEVLEQFYSGKIGRLQSMLYFSNLETFILNNKITLLYIRYTHFANPLFNSFLKKIVDSGVRIVMEIPTFPYDHEYNQAGTLSQLKLKLEQCFRRTMAKYVYKFVTFSKDEQIWERPAICISNAVDPELLPISGAQFDGRQLNFIAVANLAPWHGYDRFIRSLASYYAHPNKPECDIHFYLVGDGPLLTELTNLAKQLDIAARITFHGPLDGKALDDVFASSHIGVDSLGRHRSGNNLNNSLKSKEYLVRGLPLIKSHIDHSTLDCPYIYDVSADDELFNLDHIYLWYKNLNVSNIFVRQYAVQLFTWDRQFFTVMDSL